jgi:hypothetical protein
MIQLVTFTRSDSGEITINPDTVVSVRKALQSESRTTGLIMITTADGTHHLVRDSRSEVIGR